MSYQISSNDHGLIRLFFKSLFLNIHLQFYIRMIAQIGNLKIYIFISKIWAARQGQKFKKDLISYNLFYNFLPFSKAFYFLLSFFLLLVLALATIQTQDKHYYVDWSHKDHLHNKFNGETEVWMWIKIRAFSYLQQSDPWWLKTKIQNACISEHMFNKSQLLNS